MNLGLSHGYEYAQEDLFALLDMNTLPELTDEIIGASFDELRTIAAMQPENSTVLEGLRQTVRVAVETGRLRMAYEMAMTLGAMACTHEHMQSLSKEINQELPSAEAEHSHDYRSNDSKPHDAVKCRNCKSGKPCRKK